jgi:hypothetical protein
LTRHPFLQAGHTQTQPGPRVTGVDGPEGAAGGARVGLTALPSEACAARVDKGRHSLTLQPGRRHTLGLWGMGSNDAELGVGVLQPMALGGILVLSLFQRAAALGNSRSREKLRLRTWLAASGMEDKGR